MRLDAFVCVLTVTVSLAGVLAPSALAQATPEDVNEVELAIEAYEAGRLVEARRRFARAHDAAPSARTLRGLGVVSFALGDYLEAEALLSASLEHPTLPLTEELRALVVTLIDRARAGLGQVRFDGLEPGDVVRIDGAPARARAHGAFTVQPGAHSVSVLRDGASVLETSFEAGPGETATLNVEARSESAAPPDAVVVADVVSPSPASQRERRGVRAGLPTLLAGAGVAAIGVALYGVALARHAEVERDCDHVCSQAEIDARFDARRIEPIGRAGATLAAAGLGVTITGAVLHAVGRRRGSPRDVLVVGPRAVAYVRTF